MDDSYCHANNSDTGDHKNYFNPRPDLQQLWNEEMVTVLCQLHVFLICYSKFPIKF